MTGAAADEWNSQGVPNSILLQKPRFGVADDSGITTAQRNAASISCRGGRNSLTDPEASDSMRSR
jgi:hypothetical protein